MNRRDYLLALLAIGVASGTLPGRALAKERIRHIGWLTGDSQKSVVELLAAFRAGLKERGWVEGHNIELEMRLAEGHMERVAGLAEELVRLKPDIILTSASVVAIKVKKATSTIPIVMAICAAPVEWGLVKSLAHPGGNVTGLSGFFEATPVKMLEAAALLVPRDARVGALLEAETPFSRPRYRNDFERTAKALDLRTEFEQARTPEDVPVALAALAEQKPAILFVLPGPMFFTLGANLVRHAEALKVPVIYPFESMVEAGGLMAYSVSVPDSYHRAAYYVDSILKGAKPGDLPIEQPTRLWLTVNLRTAAAHGIRMPQSILLQADRVIE
jgi:ABC-type uncharacterized transport system substrate-binding protein